MNFNLSMKQKFTTIVSFAFFNIVIFYNTTAADYFAFQGGAWNNTGNWRNASCSSGSTGTYPNNAADNATICGSGTAVSLGAFTMACNNLTINGGVGTLTFTGAGIVNVAGNLTMQSGAVISSATATGTINVAGDFIMYSGTTGSFINCTGGRIILNVTGNMYVYTGSGGTAEIQNNVDLFVSGTTTVNGPLVFTVDENGTNWDKTFVGLVTINAGGTWTSTAQTSDTYFTFRGGITNNGGTFSAGHATFNTNNQLLTGPGALNFSDNVLVNLITVTNNTTVNMTGTMVAALAGTGNWTQGVNSVLNYRGQTLTVTNFDPSANGNTVNYDASSAVQTIRGSGLSSYWHLTSSNANTKTLGGNVDVNGNLTIATAATATTFGTFTYNINLAGDWINNSTAADPFTQATNLVTFDGSSQQTVTNTGDAQGTEFYNVTINNTSSTGVVVSTSPSSMVIYGGATLTLTDGYLITTSSNLLIINDNATATSGSAASFVDGPVRKIGDDAFVFPTGDDVAPAGADAGDRWARIGFSDPGITTTDYYTAEYFKTSYSDLSVLSPLTDVSQEEYWILDRVVSGSPAVSVTLYTEDCSFSKINDCPDLTAVRYNGTDWEDEGQSAISSTGCNSPTTQPLNITSNAITTFSPFTFGSKSLSVNPFPVELLSFDAYRDGTTLRVRCDWNTATETNNDYFAIERSNSLPSGGQGWAFEQIGTVQGAGNSTTIQNYVYYDNEPYYGLSYYRLKQVDYDGSFTYSNIASVYIGGLEIVNIYPNPASDNVNIVIYAEQNTQAVISAINALGQKVYAQEIFLQKGKTEIKIPVKQFLSGIYIFKAVLPSGECRQKIFLH